MRKTTWVFCAVACGLVWSGCIALFGTAIATEPCADPVDPCVEALLDQFTPWMFFEDNGPGGARREFPARFTGADDDTSENNAENLSTSPDYAVYRHAERIATAGAPCWLLEYHYYLPLNWHAGIWEANGYTHEHDWEWVYVLAGWSWRLQRYVGYAATLSSHDGDNLTAMHNHHTYVFPLITIDPDMEDEFVRGARRLSDWTSDTETLLTRAAVVMTADGNALRPYEPGLGGLRDVGLPASSETPPIVWQLGQHGTACHRSTASENCYGDPSVCTLPFVCSGHDDCADCAAHHYVPWQRAGLWYGDSVPTAFVFPGDLRTSVDPQPGLACPLEVETTASGVCLQWEWGEAPPDSFEAWIETEALQWRCRLGAVCGRPAGIRYRLTSASPCLRGVESAGSRLTVWALWDDGRRQPAASALMASSAARLQFRQPANPFTKNARVQFYLASASDVELETLDAAGRRIIHRSLGRRPAGWQSVEWIDSAACSRSLPSGVYWLRVNAGSWTGSCRICFVR